MNSSTALKAAELIENHGPRFPGLVQNVILGLEEYERRLKGAPWSTEISYANLKFHLEAVRTVIEDLKGWEFD